MFYVYIYIYATHIHTLSSNGDKWAVLCMRACFANSPFAFELEILDYRTIFLCVLLKMYSAFLEIRTTIANKGTLCFFVFKG